MNLYTYNRLPGLILTGDAGPVATGACMYIVGMLHGAALKYCYSCAPA